MLFPTFTFAVFFVIVLCLGWLLHSRPVLWKLFMVGASYVFYAWWNPRFVLLLVASTVVNTVCGRIIGNSKKSNHTANTTRTTNTTRRKAALTLAVLYNLGVLGFFKYHDFFISSIEDGLEELGLSVNLPLLQVVLPVGISFFTFQALSYVIDVYRGKIPACNLLDFAVYLAFFPQLVAGPIVRASEFLPQLSKRLNPLEIDITRAAILIASGLFKKVVISSYMADALVDDVFGFPERFSGLEIMLAVYGYSIQIYADFSGYTDIAIGVAMLLGFRFPENFNQPYRATSIQDFWRRWHITLSSWLRDYLYIPLGGNRGGKLRRDRNLLLTMLLGGLWHGAAWPFVIWGTYQGTGMLVERRFAEFTDGNRRNRNRRQRSRLQLSEDSVSQSSRSSLNQPSLSQSSHSSFSQPTQNQPPRSSFSQPPHSQSSHSSLNQPTQNQPPHNSRNQPPRNYLKNLLKWLVTFHFVCLGWLFFRSETLDDAIDMFRQLFTSFLTPAPELNIVFIGVIIGALVAQTLSRTALERLQANISRLPLWIMALSFGAWMLVIDQFGPEGVAPFIYFQF